MSSDAAYEDRLAVAARDLQRVVGRLGRLSPASVRHHRGTVVTLVGTLVAVCSRQQSKELSVPDVEDHVLADVVAVIGQEVLDELVASPDEELAEAVGSAIQEALAATR